MLTTLESLLQLLLEMIMLTHAITLLLLLPMLFLLVLLMPIATEPASPTLVLAPTPSVLESTSSVPGSVEPLLPEASQVPAWPPPTLLESLQPASLRELLLPPNSELGSFLPLEGQLPVWCLTLELDLLTKCFSLDAPAPKQV